MEKDNGHSLSEPEESKSSVDPHRAQRELERNFFYGGDAREMSEMMSRRQLPASWSEGAEVAFAIVEVPIFDEEGKKIGFDIEYVRPNASPINETLKEE